MAVHGIYHHLVGVGSGFYAWDIAVGIKAAPAIWRALRVFISQLHTLTTELS